MWIVSFVGPAPGIGDVFTVVIDRPARIGDHHVFARQW